jgi:hypothetical protein
MENLSTELIATLHFLLPGFISAWIFHALTSYPKQSQFERVIQALIFTVIIQSVLFLLFYFSAINIEKFELIFSLIIAIILGLFLAYFTNNDKFHKILRKLKITKETSYASEWFSAFSERVTYIVIHLKDGRRILGWPMEWSTEPNNGHFLLSDASWIDDDNKEIALKNVENILIDSSDVKLVEFLKLKK